jgi:1,4-dihydroxy-2-naphthoate octaprenyltransferase
MTGHLSLNIMLMSISTGLLTVGLLHTHALMDFDFDIKDKKRTLCTILKTKNNALLSLGIMMAIAYINIIVGILLNLFSYNTLLTFITLPLAISLYYLMKLGIDHPEIIPERKFWMGPMDNWAEVKAANAESFMLKFYISRNIMMFFAIFLCIGILL